VFCGALAPARLSTSHIAKSLWRKWKSTWYTRAALDTYACDTWSQNDERRRPLAVHGIGKYRETYSVYNDDLIRRRDEELCWKTCNILACVRGKRRGWGTRVPKNLCWLNNQTRNETARRTKNNRYETMVWELNTEKRTGLPVAARVLNTGIVKPLKKKKKTKKNRISH